MINQNDIANYFKSKYGIKIDQARISRILRGKKQVSWSFANALSFEFPGRTIQQWKNATPEELRRAFDLLPKQALSDQIPPEAA